MENFSKELNNLGGAAVRGEAVAGFLTETERVNLLVKIEDYMQITEKHSQTHPLCEQVEESIYAMVDGLIEKRAALKSVEKTESSESDLDKTFQHLLMDNLSVSQHRAASLSEVMVMFAKLYFTDKLDRAASAPSEPSELVKELREYAGNPGYSHNDYADTMRRAADALDSQPGITAKLKRWEAYAFSTSLDERNDDLCQMIEELMALDSQPTVAAQQGSIGDDAQFEKELKCMGQGWTDAMMTQSANGVYIDNELRWMRRGWKLAIDSRASSAPAAPIAPDGWQLVPIEPTDAMYFAACHAFHAWKYTTTEQPDFTHADTYRAMLAAAPAPQQEGSEAGNG